MLQKAVPTSLSSQRGHKAEGIIVQANSCDHNDYKNYFNVLMLSSKLQWLEETFLPYLKEWEASVARREGFSKAEKKKMKLFFFKVMRHFLV